MKRATMYTTRLGGEGITQEIYETSLIPDSKAQELDVVNLYPQKKYQTIQGFGAALTESSGYTLARMILHSGIFRWREMRSMCSLLSKWLRKRWAGLSICCSLPGRLQRL